MKRPIIERGLILEKPHFEDWVFNKGNFIHRLFKTKKTIGSQPINPSGDWTSYLPTEEFQKKRAYDDFGCVSHSAQNVLETLLYYKMVQGDDDIKSTLYALNMLDENGKPNFSDWFTVLMSGTIPWRGNTQRNVWECVRKDGLLDYHAFTFDDNTTQDSYNDKSKITQAMIEKALKFLEHFQVNWEWIPQAWFGAGKTNLESWREVLTHSPIQIVVNSGTHCEMAYKVEDSDILSFNSYADVHKRRNYGLCQYGAKAEITLKKKLDMPELYKKKGEPAIYFLNPDDMVLVPYADGIISGGSMFKTTGLLYSMAKSVETLPYPVADYSMTTIKNSELKS